MSISNNIHGSGNSIFLNDKPDYFPEHTVYSLPVFTKKGERVFHASFLFLDERNDNNTIARPFAWSLMPLDDSPEYAFNWCIACDFINTAEYPLNMQVSATCAAEAFSAEELRSTHIELLELFNQMTEFALQEHLISLERTIVDRYRELFDLLCPQGLLPFYQALAPDFCAWIGLPPATPHEEDLTQEGAILQKLETLEELFTTKIVEDARKTQLFDELHEELQRYKSNAYEELARAVERDVVLVLDNIQKNKKWIAETPTEYNVERMQSLYEAVEQDLIDLLYRQGIDPYQTQGDEVQIPKQKVLAVEATGNAEQDKKIAERLTWGWCKGEQIIRPEYIRVYLYEKDMESANH